MSYSRAQASQLISQSVFRPSLGHQLGGRQSDQGFKRHTIGASGVLAGRRLRMALEGTQAGSP